MTSGLTVLEVYYVRLRLLNLFRAGRLSIDQIEQVLGWPRVAVSKHLKFLCSQNLIAVEQEQDRTFFRFQDESCKQLRVHLEALDDERDPTFQADVDQLKKVRKKLLKQKLSNH